MKQLVYLLCSVAALTAASCSEEDLTPENIANNTTRETIFKPNDTKAAKIAEAFAGTRGVASSQSANKSVLTSDITSSSYYIDNGDTLLFAYNFGDSEGYVVVAGRLAGCPVVAQSDTGRIDVTNIGEQGPFEFFVSLTANRLSEAPADSTSAEFWKDIDNDEYSYTVECQTEDNGTNKSTRYTTPKGWEHIFPSTGYQIGRRWSQNGDYSSAAKNGAYIGCPAVAIGMLLYDISLRDTGSKLATWPQFTYNDIRTWKAKEVSQKFRQIADMIPNYNWGSGQGKSSGASGLDIVSGLKALGFSGASISSFNLSTAYSEMCYTEGGKSKHRGILLCGHSSPNNGHIWFCDGYQEAAYQVTKKRKGKVVSQHTEYESQLFMNWGQGTTKNGYFAVDGNTGLTSEAPYHNWVMMITGLKNYKKINK